MTDKEKAPVLADADEAIEAEGPYSTLPADTELGADIAEELDKRLEENQQVFAQAAEAQQDIMVLGELAHKMRLILSEAQKWRPDGPEMVVETTIFGAFNGDVLSVAEFFMGCIDRAIKVSRMVKAAADEARGAYQDN